MKRSSREGSPKAGEPRSPDQPAARPESVSTQHFVDVVMARLKLERALKRLHQHTHK